jgi:hypothetical protein
MRITDISIMATLRRTIMMLILSKLAGPDDSCLAGDFEFINGIDMSLETDAMEMNGQR